MKFRWLLLLIIPIPALVSFLLIGNDTIYVLTWWACILLVGLIFLPITSKLFSRFFDKGYIFSKTIGLAFLTFILWFFSSLKILPFLTITVYFLLIAAIIIIYIVFKGFDSLKALLKDASVSKAFIYEEALLLLLLVLFAFVKGHGPSSGVESRMDFAFLNNLLNTKYMPPVDVWFAGVPINYYFYGQYVFAFLTKMCNIDSAITYNLSYISLFAFGFTLTFSLAANMFYLIGKQKMKNVIIAGLISAFLLSLGGNLQTIIYASILPTAKSMGFYGEAVGKVDREYFYADPRSFIGTNPGVGDMTITEFPAYSLILGDLHAQIIDIIFVLTFLAILLALLFLYIKQPKIRGSNKKWYQLPFEYIFVVLLLPIMFMTNTWDFPIYITVTAFVILYINYKKNDFKSDSLALAFTDGMKIVILSVLLLIPFIINFFDPTDGPKFANLAHLLDPIYIFKMFVIWGYQLFFVVLFAVYFFKTAPKQSQIDKSNAILKRSERKVISNKPHPKSSIAKFISERKRSDVFALILCICAIGLIIVSEIIYQKDASGGNNARANTVWKVTLQAFIMFDVVVGYITMRILSTRRSLVQKIALNIVIWPLLCSVMFYAWYGVGQPYLGLTLQKTNPETGKSQFPIIKITSQYKSLNFETNFITDLPDDYNVVQWLRKEESGNQPVVLEANGDSYSNYERFSIYTGFPTIMGWHDHELYWRGSRKNAELDIRVADVSTVYTSLDINATKVILEKYNVKYIVVGKLEKDKFNKLNESKLLSLGSVAYQSGEAKLIKVNLYK